MRVGFTGTKQGMRPEQSQAVYVLLSKLYSKHSKFHHGDCIGADIQAASMADCFGYFVVCHPPVKRKYRGWFQNNDAIMAEYDYVVRDHSIVDSSEVLIATPHTSYEIIRSGTWTTIRYARGLNRPIYIVKPDGTIKTENLT